MSVVTLILSDGGSIFLCIKVFFKSSCHAPLAASEVIRIAGMHHCKVKSWIGWNKVSGSLICKVIRGGSDRSSRSNVGDGSTDAILTDHVGFGTIPVLEFTFSNMSSSIVGGAPTPAFVTPFMDLAKEFLNEYWLSIHSLGRFVSRSGSLEFGLLVLGFLKVEVTLSGFVPIVVPTLEV